MEATYEESKQRGLVLGLADGLLFGIYLMRNPSYGMEVYESQLVPGLEATYEESKHVARSGYPDVVLPVWKLPMRNPSKREDSSGS